MTFIRYRCEHQPDIGKVRGGAPAEREVHRLAGGEARHGSLGRLPRAITRPEPARSAAEAFSVPATPLSAPESMPASSSTRTKRALDGLRVLIVEDDDDARELVGIILFNAGAVVQSSASAAHGFNLILESRPQLLVSDIGMPNEDGYSLMRRIRALQCCDGGDILSIALSAFTRPEDRMLALRAGFTIHIAKPVHPSDLVSAVSALAALIWHREQQLAR